MSFWNRLFGPRETPEETVRRTRRALELIDAGKSDEEVERSLVADVRKVRDAKRSAS